jgi:uncharacterized protein (DUF849 family)
MASLTLSSLNFNNTASINSPDIIKGLASKMLENGIKPELEVFDLGMVNYMNYLISKGLIEAPYYANVILNNIACAQADVLHLGTILKDFPKDTFVSIGGVGKAQLPMNSLSIAMGHGVRAGIEDNYWYDDFRQKKATNVEILTRVHNIINANEKTVMKPKTLRELLNLNEGNGSYGVKS